MEKKDFSRRELLNLAAWFTALTAGGYVISQLPRVPQLIMIKERREGLRQLQQLALFIDFPEDANFDPVLRRLLGALYKSRKDLFMAYPKDYLTDVKQFEKKLILNPKLAPAAFAYGFIDRYRGHGKLTTSKMLRMLEKYGYTMNIPMANLHEAIADFKLSYDDLANITASTIVSEGRLIEILANFPNLAIVNMSFQVGRSEIDCILRRKKIPNVSVSEIKTNGELYYIWGAYNKVITHLNKHPEVYLDLKGKKEVVPVLTEEEYQKKLERESEIEEFINPQFLIKEAYNADYAEENLLRLIKLCNAYPDKLFIAAAGNEDSFFYEARERLKDQWPENLLLVGVLLEDFRISKTYAEGADLYLSNKLSILDRGTSSEATALVTAIASLLKNEGFQIMEIKEMIMEIFSSEVEYTANIPGALLEVRKGRLFNIEVIDDFFRERSVF
ncbi:MAG: hypothetical protein PVJ09_02985 [Candidatus Woesebacteria bacterium]|jgi:hypothetical protein